MIVVALAAVVLLGALALAVDWGYGLTQRRVMQTSADAAALAVGRYLATSVLEINGEIAFIVSQADACEVAREYVEANRPFAPSAGDYGFTLQFGSGDPIAWTPISPTGGCASAPATAVPAATRYVRVTSTVTYPSLVSGVLGFPTTHAAASARAKIVGSQAPANGPVWPMVRHYDADDFNTTCVGGPDPCDPLEVDPFTFWSPNEENVVYGNFKGMVDLSRDSSRFYPTPVEQLIDEWDTSGSAPNPLKADVSGNCPAGWDTKGGEDPQNANKQCSIPNWFYYSFGGALSLDRPWLTDATAPQEPPDPLVPRKVCDPGQRPLQAPSCPDPSIPGSSDKTVGDWVETAGGNVGSNESDAMLRRIREEGSLNAPFSDRPIDPKKPDGEKFGRGLVVLIYLWDCAESYSSSDPATSQWDLIIPDKGPGKGDCSQIGKSGNEPTPDRVHLFTAAPFTFYEGLVSSQTIKGFWGGAWGTSLDCATWTGDEPMCAVNPLANSAVLIADDNYTGP